MTTLRAQRRQRSRDEILRSAASLFAERGYERATIRAIATKAGVDPALVMQHFGNKEKLFAAAAATTTDVNAVTMASSPDLAGTAIAHVFADYDDAERHAQAIALLRGSMTNATAAEIVRTEIMGKAQAAIAKSIGGDDAALRAALLNACTLGLTISRYLLKIQPLVEASPDEIASILSPALRRILEAQAESLQSQP